MEIQELVRALSALPAATLYEGMGKVGAIHHKIRPLSTGFRLAGIAYTIRILPGETLAVLRAIEEAPVGSVLVIDTSGDGESAVWGGNFFARGQSTRFSRLRDERPGSRP